MKKIINWVLNKLKEIGFKSKFEKYKFEKRKIKYFRYKIFIKEIHLNSNKYLNIYLFF